MNLRDEIEHSGVFARPSNIRQPGVIGGHSPVAAEVGRVLVARAQAGEVNGKPCTVEVQLVFSALGDLERVECEVVG